MSGVTNGACALMMFVLIILEIWGCLALPPKAFVYRFQKGFAVELFSTFLISFPACPFNVMVFLSGAAGSRLNPHQCNIYNIKKCKMIQEFIINRICIYR